ncbi:hypothetical protein TanjilG_25937 [Lupinus angustifolius]|uniref:Uncharacterized protein n=1 Tax=Lupinus angustifolius TaxID=3871 RepID=A0A1J7HK70_LUPAN|nr:hypothetical protein TanjilG_25937 [Lupinus angustifolius]
MYSTPSSESCSNSSYKPSYTSVISVLDLCSLGAGIVDRGEGRCLATSKPKGTGFREAVKKAEKHLNLKREMGKKVYLKRAATPRPYLIGLGGYTYYNMEDLAREEGGSDIGFSQRPVLNLNLPPSGRDKLSDLIAKLDQVEREIHHLSECRIESPEEGEACQFSLLGLHTVLDKVGNSLEQFRQLDGSRDEEQARQRQSVESPFIFMRRRRLFLMLERRPLRKQVFPSSYNFGPKTNSFKKGMKEEVVQDPYE